QSPSVLGNQSSLNFEEIMGDYFGDRDSNDSDSNYSYTLDYEDTAPCHNHFCPLFQRVAPPFLSVTCALAVLGTAALLVALAKRPQAWQWPQSRTLVAQLALAMGLFAALLPALATGIAWGWHLGTGLCRLAHLLWHWSLFAQALLVGSGSWGTTWARWDPRSRRLAMALWAVALLLAVPAALAGGTVAGTGCVRRSVGILSPAYLLHLTFLLGLLLLLPMALLVATLVVPRQRASWRAGGAASWLFFGLWAPYGLGLALEFLLHAHLLEPTCGTFERFDHALGLSEGLGVLHCTLGPPVLLLARLC
ncbi:ACKR1 protein, partial [Grallaria varia]|nr:ACKR1 protein [Grallaria varia]